LTRGILIQVKDKDGKIIDERRIGLNVIESILNIIKENKGDLGTDWFGRALSSAFNGSTKFVNIQTEDGSEGNVFFNIGSASSFFAGSYDSFWGGIYRCVIPLFSWVAIGRGTGTPQRQDLKLFNEYKRNAATSTYTDGTGVVAIAAQFLFSESQNITEVGLLLCSNDSSQSNSGKCVLVDHTVLDSPISVNAGKTIYVEYRLLI